MSCIKACAACWHGCFVIIAARRNLSRRKAVTIARLQPMVEEGYWDKVCWKTLEELQSFFLEHLDVKMSIGLSEGVDPDETGLIMQRMKAECLRRDNFGGLLRFPIEEKAENGNEN